MKLGFGNCRLCIQAPVKMGYTDPKQLIGKRIVTSFTKIATGFFQTLDPDTETTVTFVSGSVEAACSLGLADAVVDLVESGDTMRAAGLEVVASIMDTESVLISNPKNLSHAALIKMIKKRIAGHLYANKNVYLVYNIKRELLAQATVITPGMKAPTVTPLDNAEWCAVNVMVPKKEVHDKMDELEELGATDILQMNIANCRTGAC